MKGTALREFNLDKLPNYIELSVKRLTDGEIMQYIGKLEYISEWENGLKEIVVANNGTWYLIKWA